MSDEQVLRPDNFDEDDECPAAWVTDWLDDPAVEHTVQAIIDRLSCSRAEAVQVATMHSIDISLIALVDKLGAEKS